MSCGPDVVGGERSNLTAFVRAYVDNANCPSGPRMHWREHRPLSFYPRRRSCCMVSVGNCTLGIEPPSGNL